MSAVPAITHLRPPCRTSQTAHKALTLGFVNSWVCSWILCGLHACTPHTCSSSLFVTGIYAMPTVWAVGRIVSFTPTTPRCGFVPSQDTHAHTPHMPSFSFFVTGMPLPQQAIGRIGLLGRVALPYGYFVCTHGASPHTPSSFYVFVVVAGACPGYVCDGRSPVWHWETDVPSAS